MTTLEVRRPKFDFTGDIPWEWNPANPQFSFFMNATSMIAICFEQFLVAAVQEAKPLINDPEVAAEATAFLRQDAQHSSTHRKHVAALIKRYPGLQQTFDAAMASFDDVTNTTPLKFRLAYIADLEATFTPSFKMMLDNEATLFRPGDDRVASLLLWHFVEEVEHRSSALVIFDAAVGDSWYRIRALPRIFRHLIAVTRIIATRECACARIGSQGRRPYPVTDVQCWAGAERATCAEAFGDPERFCDRSSYSAARRRSSGSAEPDAFHNPADEPLPIFRR